MYKSKEIRWFTQKESTDIIKWFAAQGLSFNNIIPRSDYYLLALDTPDMALKIREGKIEIKHKVGQLGIKRFAPKIEGHLEEWIRWSFQLDSHDCLSNEITAEKRFKPEWLEVHKERMALKLVNGLHGKIQFYDITEIVDSGCQLEYSRIKVNDRLFFSFNLEWFGDEFVALDAAFISEIVGPGFLKLEDSMGYASFLKSMNT